MNTLKEDIKIKKNNNFFDVIYKNEVIFRTDKKSNINTDKIYFVINQINKKYSGSDSKIMKYLINLEISKKINNDKQKCLLNKLIIEDKECLKSIRKLSSNSLNEFLALSAVDDINYQQYNPKRLYKKWSIFLLAFLTTYFFNLETFWIVILFFLFIVTEPKPFSKILLVFAKINKNK